MRKYSHVLFSCSWIAIQIATLVSASHAQTLPSTQATSNPIVEVVLDNPLTPESRCYLDLDTGKIYPRGQLIPDMIELRRWIREKGIDLMCETRAPAEGIVNYGLALIESDKSIDSSFDYAGVRDRLQAIEPQPFDLVKLGETPKTYEFRTPEGSIGAMEIASRRDAGPGLRIRFKLLHAPPLPLISPKQEEMARLAQQIQAQKKILETLDASQKVEIGLVQSGIEMLQKQSDIFTNEPDLEIAFNKMRLLQSQYLVDSFQQKPGESDPFIEDVKEDITGIENRIAVLERTRNSPSDRKAALLQLGQTEVKRWMQDIARRYDEVHPVVDPALKELSVPEKVSRMMKSDSDDQLARAKQAKHRVEELLASDEERSLPGALNVQILSAELSNYASRIASIQAQRAEMDRREQLKPRPLKPATFPSVSNFRL